MTVRGKGPLRFRRTNYNEKGNYSSVPKWHRAAGPYDEGQYKQLVAICGYTVPPSIALFLGYKLTRAVTPQRGELCSKCERVAADEAEYAKHHPSKKEEGIMAEHDEVLNDPEFKAWAAHVAENVAPKMKASALTVTLVPKSESDIKYAVELGLSIMMDKPIITVCEVGQVLPDKLIRVSDKIVEVDWRGNPEGAHEAIGLAMTDLIAEKGL